MRIKVLLFIYLIVIFLIILRLWQWQILSSDELTARAERQRLFTSEVLAKRGSILFSDDSTLASTQPVFLIFAQPKLIKDKSSFANKLAEKIAEYNNQEDKKKELAKDIFTKITKDLYWVSLGRVVDTNLKKNIEKLNLTGLGFEESFDRFYPEGSSSAHILGFVGSDIYGEPTGYFGLEGAYNGELRGKDGLLRQEKDAQGLPILIGDFILREPVEGKTLVLNIDRTVQFIVEEKLKKGMEKYGAKGVSAVVMEPKTGNILAMASLPSYDPQNPSSEFKDYFKNPLIADGYEPGSTFKVMVMAAGINESVIKPDTKCDICEGPLSIGGFVIRTWNNKYHENSTMTDVIVHSDNTGMVFVAKKLGLDKLFSYIESFGFGRSTGIDQQDEYTPPLRPKEEWREIDLATASFGQGIAVTGVQMVKAVAAIANGGKLMEPHLVKEIRSFNPDGGLKETYSIKPREITRPISTQTAKVVSEMMVKAVEEGESKFLKTTGFKVAGKTGTAQIPVAGHYDPNKTIASFVGFAPADDPRFIILVRYLEPSTSVFGSETAAPTFFEIAKELFVYYGISPAN